MAQPVARGSHTSGPPPQLTQLVDAAPDGDLCVYPQDVLDCHAQH
jgi:hypothetical protein